MRRVSKKGSLRNKADKLLQDYIKATHKDCLVCGKPMICGHHFVPKKNSNALRYYLPNIIPICRECHSLVHSQPSLANPKICFIKGEAWFKDIEAIKRIGVKVSKAWYEENIEILKGLQTLADK